METRGVIRNREFAQQIRDFSGLRFGSITPTDIDAFLDFGGRRFVLIEAKHGTCEPKYGQRLALERLCDACQASGIETILVFASHDTDGDIDFGSLSVTRYRYKKEWWIWNRTLKELIELFRKPAT